MWILFTLISAVLFAASSLAVRVFSRVSKDSWMLSFMFSSIIACILLPYAVFTLDYSAILANWLLIVVTGIVLVAGNWAYFSAFKFLDTSTITITAKLRLVWAYIIGVIFFAEILSVLQLLGTGLIVVAGMLPLDFKKTNFSYKGVLLILSYSVFAAGYLLCAKILLDFFSPFHLLFLMGLVPAALNFVLIPKFKERFHAVLPHWRVILLVGATGAFANFFLYLALGFDVFSQVYIALEATLVFVLLGEIFLLREREKILRKIIAIVLAIIGVALLA